MTEDKRLCKYCKHLLVHLVGTTQTCKLLEKFVNMEDEGCEGFEFSEKRYERTNEYEKELENTNRFVEVNMDENNELVRVSFLIPICPRCKLPMRILAKYKDNIYQCYCAYCQTDRYMKDTLDIEKSTFKE